VQLPPNRREEKRRRACSRSDAGKQVVATETSLSILVPAHNEQYLIEASLRRLAVLGESARLARIKVIVVDDHSTDQTPAAIERFRASLSLRFGEGKFEWVFLRHEENQGKGGAVRTALEHADTEFVVIHDADLEYHPQDLVPMLAVALDEGADAVFGSRFLSGGFHRVLYFRHALGNSLLTFLSNLVSDLNLTDMETCYKMVRTSLLRSVPLESRDFRIEPEITIKLAKRGARIFEVPISYSGRTYQEGKKINWKDGVRALAAIVKFGLSDNIYKGEEFGEELPARWRRGSRYAAWVADRLRPHLGARVLELGAGSGSLTVQLTPRQAYWATDPNPHHIRQLEELGRTRPYLRVQMTDAARAETFPQGEKFDTVLAVNVLQRVQDDVEALVNIRRVLAEGGRAVLVVPQGPELFGSLDRALGHLRRYTGPELAAAGNRAGFALRELEPFNYAGTLVWWLNSKVFGRSTMSLAEMGLLNWLLPIVRVCDRAVPLPGLSLLAVFEKMPTEPTRAEAEAATAPAPAPAPAAR
jgi:glycosyltransferase involved in cell wall biosynthesis